MLRKYFTDFWNSYIFYLKKAGFIAFRNAVPGMRNANGVENITWKVNGLLECYTLPFLILTLDSLPCILLVATSEHERVKFLFQVSRANMHAKLNIKFQIFSLNITEAVSNSSQFYVLFLGRFRFINFIMSENICYFFLWLSSVSKFIDNNP